MYKKLISLLLCVVTLLTFFSAVPVNAAHPFASAEKLEPGCAITDSCGHNESRYYRIKMPYTGKLIFTFEHEWFEQGIYYEEWDITIYIDRGNAEYDLYMSVEIYPDSKEELSFMPIGAKKGEVLCIEISASCGCVDTEYTFSAKAKKTSNYETESNDTYASADSLELNTKRYGNTEDNSVDFYSYKMPTSGTLTFEFYHKKVDRNSDYTYWYLKVYQKKKGEYKTIGDYRTYSTNGTAKIEIKNAKKNQKYYFYVEGFGNAFSYNYVGDIQYSVKPVVTLSNKPAKPKATISSKRKATVKWSKVSGATGYQLQISKKSSFKKLVVDKKLKGKSKTKYVKKLSRKTKYYVRVRAYKKVGKTYYYSGWSSKRKFKTK